MSPQWLEIGEGLLGKCEETQYTIKPTRSDISGVWYLEKDRRKQYDRERKQNMISSNKSSFIDVKGSHLILRKNLIYPMH